MKVRKSAVTLWVLVLVGMVVVSGCGPVITVETPVPTPVAAIVEAGVATKTPVPTPDMTATIEAAVAAVLASQPTPDIAATVEAAVAVALASQPAPDVAATVEAAVATKMAATQTAQSEQAVTPTPAPPTAAPKPTDTPTVGPTDTPIPTDTPTVPCVSPTIEFTHVPPYGNDYEDLKGQVACVEPADYKVAVYIYVDGWYNKPYLASPLTTIGKDGIWRTDITLSEYDSFATSVAAFLISDGYSPPLMGGETTFPEGLYENSVDYVIADRERDSRTIEFSGYT